MFSYHFLRSTREHSALSGHLDRISKAGDWSVQVSVIRFLRRSAAAIIGCLVVDCVVCGGVVGSAIEHLERMQGQTLLVSSLHLVGS